MAKSQADVLFERLRANGLRKRVARDLSQALSAASGSGPSKAAQGRITELRKLVRRSVHSGGKVCAIVAANESSAFRTAWESPGIANSLRFAAP